MKLTKPWLICLAVLLKGAVKSHASEDPKPPNLIVIMTDEHNLRTIGAYREQLGKKQSFPWGDGVAVESKWL